MTYTRNPAEGDMDRTYNAQVDRVITKLLRRISKEQPFGKTPESLLEDICALVEQSTLAENTHKEYVIARLHGRESSVQILSNAVAHQIRLTLDRIEKNVFTPGNIGIVKSAYAPKEGGNDDEDLSY